MYGTIAKLHLKSGAEKDFVEHARETSASIPGFVFEHLYRMDEDPEVVYLVVGFTDKAAYRKNAESSEQQARYEQYRSWLDADPEWHDGEIAFSLP